MLLYNFAFSVFPHACPQGLDIGVCSVLSGWPENWSFVVWAVVAISFGWFTRGLSWRTKLGVGVVAVALTILAMQAGMPLFGFQHYVDAL